MEPYIELKPVMTIKAKALVAPWKVTNANRDQTELDENKQEHTSIIKLHEHHEYHLVPDIHNKPSQNKNNLKFENPNQL